MIPEMTSLEQFFWDHAGYSHDPKKESRWQGRIKCAKELAAAWTEFLNEDACVTWEIDPDITSHDWEDSSKPERPTLIATLYCGKEIVGSLGGIDIPGSGDPYAKVIEAELWQEFSAWRDKMIVRGEN